MALPHVGAGQPCDVRPLGEALAGTPSSALFKSEQLEVIRLVLPAGRSMPPHRVAGEITLQCLEGELALSLAGGPQRLAAGQLLFLRGGELHGLQALSDASALLTLVLRGPA